MNQSGLSSASENNKSALGVVSRVLPPAEPQSGVIVYGVTARISARQPSYALRIQHELPAGVILVRTDPPALQERGRLLWNLGDLEAGKEVRLQVAVQPRPGVPLDPTALTSFHLIYSSVLHLQTPLARPKIEMTTSDPGRIRVGHVFRMVLEIRNAGNAPVEKEQLIAILPEGLFHPSGPRLIVPIRHLAPGEVMQVAIAALAERAGSEVIRFECAGQCIERSIQLVAPELRATIETSARAAVGTILGGAVHVRNEGTSAAEHVRLKLECPVSVELCPESNSLGEWTIPVVAPGEMITLPFQCRSEIPVEGVFRLHVSGSESHQVSEQPVAFDPVPIAGPLPLEQFLEQISQRMEPRSRSTAPEPSRNETEPGLRHIVFSVAGVRYAVPIEGVAEVARSLRVTPVPNLPLWLLGVANLRGDMVSVMSLGQFFGQDQEVRSDAKALVLKWRGHEVTVAVVIDHLLGLRALTSTELRPFPEGIDHPASTFASGVADFDVGMTIVLDLPKLLSSPGLCEFQGV